MPTAAEIICLLDDEPCVLKALGRLLDSEGFHAEKFSEPAGFLEHARSHPVQLAVIDIQLPGISGLDVLAELRVISPAARVILMTGQIDASHRETAMAAGASAFFFKPFDDEAFLAAVRRALTRACR